MLDDRVLRPFWNGWSRKIDQSERQACRRNAGRARSRRRPVASSSRSRRRRPGSRCSRSAARAATRRSGWPPARGFSAAGLVSLEHDPEKCVAWRRNIAEAGLEEWAELVEGDAFATLRQAEDVFDLVFLDAEKDDYEELFAPREAAARARRARRRRQRPLPRGSALLPTRRRARRMRRCASAVPLPLHRGLERVAEPAVSEPRT